MIKRIVAFFLLLYAGVFCLQQQDSHAGWLPLAGSGVVAYSGPGDIVSGALAAFGGRCYNTAYSGNMADVWDGATGSTTETLLTCSPGGTINQTVNSLATTCSVSCSIKTFYDMSGALSCGGAACDLTQATNSKRPVLIQSCLNGKICGRCTASSSQEMTHASSFTRAQQITYSSVFNPKDATPANTITLFASDNGSFRGPYLQAAETGSPAIRIYAGSSTAGTTVTLGSPYSVQGIFNAASSQVVINGSPATFNVGGNGMTSTDVLSLCSGNGVGYGDFDFFELTIYGIGFNSTQYGNMSTNQRAYLNF
jgi:hypothetical protein